MKDFYCNHYIWSSTDEETNFFVIIVVFGYRKVTGILVDLKHGIGSPEMSHTDEVERGKVGNVVTSV